jgi:deoxyribose-phosphate aldolase
MENMSNRDIEALVSSVDYSEALTIDATEADVREACALARKYGFRSVSIFPHYLPLAARELEGSGTLAMIVVGFPCGANTTHVKCVEAGEGLQNGATDLDMVMNIGAFKDGDYPLVRKDIESVRDVAEPFGVPFKVIVEVGALSEEEKTTAAVLVADAGATFIKTCTGFGPGRATLHDILLIKKAVGGRIGIKASGGVASIEDGVAFMRAGADVVAMRKPLVDQLESKEWHS